MTNDRISINDQIKIAEIMTDTKCLLLDFDGPICSIFSGFPASSISDQIRESLTREFHIRLPTEVASTDDPFEILKFSSTLGEIEVRHTESLLTECEIKASEIAKATTGAHSLISSWHKTGRKLAIVSNNSERAVRHYLEIHNLTDKFNAIAARTMYDPSLLKPNPGLIISALRSTRSSASSATLVGDSITDLEAALAAKTRFIGYANKSWKVGIFSRMNLSAITTSMTSLQPQPPS